MAIAMIQPYVTNRSAKRAAHDASLCCDENDQPSNVRDDIGACANQVAPVNVLLVTDVFAAADGGTEQHLLYLLRKLPRERLRVDFAILDGAHPIDPASFPIEPTMLGEGCRSGIVGAVQRIRRLARMIRQDRIDVVHTFCTTSEQTALLATRLAGRGRVLGVRRNAGYWHTRRTLWKARLLRLLGGSYAANCQAAKEFSTKNEWISADRITVIPNPLSADRLADGLENLSTRSDLGIEPEERVVCIVGTLRPVKDHGTFLRAAQLVAQEHPCTRFLVIGRQLPDTFADLQTLVRSLGIERQVTWLGDVPNPMSILPHCDVAVLSSQSEGFSNALLEYAAVGVATVATDVGGSSEVVLDGKTGFLVPPARPDAMAAKISQLLSDEEARQEFAERARRRARSEFSEQNILAKYTDLYARISGTTDKASDTFGGRTKERIQA